MKILRFLIPAFFILHASLTIAFAAESKLPQTGQTTCYDIAGAVIDCAGTGQTGDWQTGVPWPEPRFTDNGNGTITDNLTGLIWLKNANCFGSQDWVTAINSANTLTNGVCGLSDGSIAGQWRLPNIVELESLVNEQQSNPDTWLNSQGFSGVQGNDYWSASTYAYGTSYAWYVGMSSGGVYNYSKNYNLYVWPVRGGQ